MVGSLVVAVFATMVSRTSVAWQWAMARCVLATSISSGVFNMRIVFNKILNGWYIVRGRHDTPISGRFDTNEQALAYLRRRNPMYHF
jgi:hypothetical protein